jgi:hypothetical protein
VQTIQDLKSKVIVLSGTARTSWSLAVGGSAKLAVPPGTTLRLPKAAEGLEVVRAAPLIQDLDRGVSDDLRAVLLTSATVAFPLKPTIEPSRGKARRLAVGLAVQVSDGRVLFGAAEFLAVEGGLGFGQTIISEYKDLWSEQIEAIEEFLTEQLLDASDDLSARPDKGQTSWTRVVMLLGPGAEARRPEGLVRTLKLVAGLQAVNLDVRPHPDGARAAVIKALKADPPDCLLIWEGATVTPEAYERAYSTAAPAGHVDRLMPSSPLEDGLGPLALELCAHLQLLRYHWVTVPERSTYMTWTEVKIEILRLETAYFQLTDRAKRTLEANTYPDPERMFDHVRRLSLVAKAYRDNEGNLGMRLADFAMQEHGIEIALTDSTLTLVAIRHADLNAPLFAEPHVKVDDAKSPDKVGRIYFAQDPSDWRFIVDHIGLHDYGR